MGSQEYLSASEEETLAWAQGFSKQFKAGDTVALFGDLGAGKTVLCRGFAQGLGYAENVHSPTYGLVHEYPSTPPIFHMDLYRLDLTSDWEEIGLDHYFHLDGIVLVEWPERLPSDFQFRYKIEISMSGKNGRRILVRGE